MSAGSNSDFWKEMVAKEEYHSFKGLTLREDLEETQSLAVLTPLGPAMRKPLPAHSQTLKYRIENCIHGSDMRYQVTGRETQTWNETATVKPNMITKVRFGNTSEEDIAATPGFYSESLNGGDGHQAFDGQSYPTTPSACHSTSTSNDTDIANRIDRIQNELDIARAQRLIAEEDVRKLHAGQAN